MSMSRAIIGFHLRSIIRHSKAIVMHLLGKDGIDEGMLTRSTVAWHQPRDPDHPIELCKCVCGTDAPDAEHSDDCPWVAARCAVCTGSGHCPECFGDGTRGDATAPPPSGVAEEWEHA